MKQQTDLKRIAAEIIALRDGDLQLRERLVRAGELGNGYHPQMETLHKENAAKLNEIINAIGYPDRKKVGARASDAAWLIIQHSIGQPWFMRKCRDLLQTAVTENNASPVELAYLTDRIAVSEGKVQLYGTQFDWDGNGQMSPEPYDRLTLVNERRKSLSLNSLEEQTLLMRNRVKEEQQTPPPDFNERRRETEEWRKAVGWTTD